METVSQSITNERATRIINDQYTKAPQIFKAAMLKYTGIRKRNSTSYSISSNAMIKNPKLIETRRACVLVNPHS